MNDILAIYPVAIEHTKNKVFQDMESYLERRDSLPSYKQFLMDRRTFLEQIWVNVWLNKASNSVPKKQKKAFLNERGYETEGVDRKTINHLFRLEIRKFQPFDVFAWLDERFEGQEKEWIKRYEDAKMNLAKKIEEEKLAEKRKAALISIKSASEAILDNKYSYLYLYIRYYAANQLAKDLAQNPRYEITKRYQLENITVADDRLSPENYVLVSGFFDELTGGINESFYRGREFYEYETYYTYYEKLITEYLFEIAPKFIIQHEPKISRISENAFGKNINSAHLMECISDTLIDLGEEYTELVQEEYLSDLLKLTDLPFDEQVHLKRYEYDLDMREIRRAEELAEIERKRQEEARIIEDVFGQEYRPGVERNIHFVLHIGETNTGKTHQALTRMKEAESGLYLAPLRLLALEVYDKLNSEGISCSLKTGEEEKVTEGASHISCTVEMFYEKDFFDVIVIDEAQMLADKDRGFSWYKAITKANANEVHIIGSRNIKEMLLELLGKADIEINEYNRDIPLEVEQKEFNLAHVKKGDALVCFSRKKVLETASKLQTKGISVSMIYGSMPPETRKKQIQRFIDGETKIIVATDAIGMGLNLPIRRIIFLENDKFDGQRRRILSSQEIKQIAGRAGRKGLYEIGKVAFSSDINRMKKLLDQEDQPVITFAIAPTSAVFERFQKYFHDLGTFFDLWEKFSSPAGTKKAALTEERELYGLIRGTEIEARLSLHDLYSFLHLPFSSREPELKEQWLKTLDSHLSGRELPEPLIKRKSLEDLELTYKAIGLHLLFLYKLDKRTEAHYWERIREEISDEVHEHLKNEVKNYQNKCKRCGKKLPYDFPYPICNSCHASRYRRNKLDK